jgi:hypothetical protein
MRSNLGGNLASERRGRTPSPLPSPRQNSTAKSTATLISESFSSSSAALETFRTCSKSLRQRCCHRCASANCERVLPELVSSPSFLATGSRLAGTTSPAGHDQHKIFCSLSAIPPSVSEYRHIHEFWLQQKFQKTTFGLCPTSSSPTSYIPVPYLLTLGVLRNQSWVRLSRPTTSKFLFI